MLPIPSSSADLARVESNIAGQLAESSAYVYAGELRRIIAWMQENEKTLKTLSYDDVVAWRGALERKYSLNTAQRKFSILRRVLSVAVASGIRGDDPSVHVRGIKSQDSEKHRALTEDELVRLLKSVDRTTLVGARDYAILLVLAFTGLRREELIRLERADYTEREGYPVFIVTHGKGKKIRPAKLRPEVKMALDTYLALRSDDHTPLFIALKPRQHKNDQPGQGFGRLTDKAIEKIVAKYAARAGVGALLPHDLRATFATLAYEHGALGSQVQDAMGHSDPRTSDKYRKRRNRLQVNAVDVLNIDLG